MAESNGAGPEKKTLQFKAGNGFEWQGLKPDVPRVSLPHNTPSQLLNMRFKGGMVEGRGGQNLVSTHDYPITGMIDFFTEVDGGDGGDNTDLDQVAGLGDPACFATGDNMYSGAHLSENPGSLYAGIFASTTQHIAGAFINKDFSPSAMSFAFGTPGTPAEFGSSNCVYFGGTIVVAVDKVIKRLVPGTYTWDTLCTVVDGTLSRVSKLLALGTTLVMYGTNGTTVNKLLSWNGTIVTEEASLGSVYVASLEFFDSKAVAVLTWNSNGVMLRGSGGSWGAAVTLPSVGPRAGYLVSGSGAEFGGKLYIPGTGAGNDPNVADGSIYSFDGTTLVLIPYGTTGIADTGNVTGVQVLNGEMYYSWTDAQYTVDLVAYSDTWIGKYDGTIWTPRLKNLTAQSYFPSFMGRDLEANGYNPNGVLSLAVYDGRLVASCGGSTTSSQVNSYCMRSQICFSPKTGVNGNWSRLLFTGRQDRYIKTAGGDTMNQLVSTA